MSLEDQLNEAYKLRVDPTLLPPKELQFDLVELGTTNKSILVPWSHDPAKPRRNLRPTSTLPVGVPPILPDLRQQIEEFLLTPENLPIHAFQRSQKFWPREMDLDSLFEAKMSANSFKFEFERDPATGEVLGYKEVQASDVGLNAKNSMSMSRMPGLVTDPVKGLSSSCPFWPGGIDYPSLQKHVSDAADNVHDMSIVPESLCKRPPGFDYDIVFETTTKGSTPKLISGSDVSTIKISDIFSGDLVIPNIADDALLLRSDSERSDSPVTVGPVLDDIPPEVLQIPKEDKPVKSSEAVKQWAMLDTLDVGDFHRKVPDMAFKYPFELDDFQKAAVLHLENHENVLVAAHTSAGKTVVAEYAVALAQKHMRRAIYTSPIKALSNQKFRDFKTTFPEVGLLTGDVQIKPESSCLIMTTEILRSMLYNGSDVIRDIEWVIFDEIHYINDIERGVVWEEVLIMLPSHIGIILLSATVPNTLEFASWIGRTKQKEVYVVQTKKRPVPLEHFLYTGNSSKTSEELFLILDRNGTFCTEGYRSAVAAKKQRASKADESYGPKGTRQGNPNQDRNVWLSVVNMLKKKDQLPVVAFTLSKKKCDQNAEYFRNVSDLITSSERSYITTFFNRSISRLKGTDQTLPQVLWMGDLLKNGLGVHHSGILPILKEVVEMLFQKGLVKLLFATETFAMGVNMPARTVVFDSTRKFDGKNFRDLLSSEYIQMAGRAGRRGLDTTGMVVLLCKGDVQETSELHAMMLGTPTKLISQFRLTYYMILNLLRVKELTVQDMMKRSFAEYYMQKDAPENQRKLEDLRRQTETLRDPDCNVCASDLKQYYLIWAEILQLQKKVMAYIFESPSGQKAMEPGRVVVISNSNHKNCLGVVLQPGSVHSSSKFSSPSQGPLEKLYAALILCDRSYEEASLHNHFQRERREGRVDGGGGDEPDLFLSRTIFHPRGQCGQVVEDVAAGHVVDITDKKLKLEFDKIIDNHKKRLLPRFRSEEPSQSVVLAGQKLLALAQQYPDGLPLLHPVKDLHLNRLDFVDQLKRLESIKERLSTFTCASCSNFLEHFAEMRSNMRVRESVSLLEHKLSDDSLTLKEEYNQRLEVLKRLDYIDKNENLQQKGRVAFEIGSNELMLTELIINNVLTNLKPEEIVALLSCFVFEQKDASNPTLNATLEKGVEHIKETAKRVALVQKECGLDVTIEESLEELRFGLVEVVYEWAKGTSFKDITDLTDVSEGNIVRCIQRLDETCRDVRKAAHVIGVQSLCDKMEQGMSLIRRDIVFAASLYTTTT